MSDGKPPLGDTSSHPLQSPQQTPHNAFPPAGSEQGRISTSDSGAGFSGASQDNDRGSSPVFSYTHSGGNNSSSNGLASGAFGHSSAASPTGGAPYAASLSALSTSLLNMGLPAFAALPTFIPSFEPKRDSEPPYRPQVQPQPQPPQPQPRPEPQSAVQAQQAATQAATTQAATRAEAQAASTQAASVRQQQARAAAGQTPTPQTATQAALQAQRLTPAALAAITRTLAAHQQQAARMGALLMAAAGMAQPLAVQQAQRQLLAQALALALLAGKGQASAADMALLNATRQSAIAALTAGLQAKNANVSARMGAATQQTAAQAATQTSATRQSAAQTATQASSVQSAQAKQAAQEGKAKAAAQAATQAGSATQAKGREAAQAQQVAGQQASQEKTGIHKRVSLRNMPKGRARGTLDKVEAVSRNMGGPQGQPEPEDEDLDWLEEQQGQQGHAAAQEQSPAARKYQAIALWLLAHGQMAALRELAHGHRVLLLAPAADAPLTLVGHVLVPERAAVAVEDGASQMQMGAQGQALELPARWTQALPADRQWRQWKLRQQSDESGWSLQAPRPERGTPRLLAADNAAENTSGTARLANTPSSAAESAPERAELITLPEPRRLRRLLDGQWALLALRSPVPIGE